MSGRKEEELGRNGQAISEFGAVLRAWRRQRGLSVTDLALQAGFGHTGRSYISKIEHGLIRHVAEERLERIAAVLGVTVDDLLAKRWPGQTTGSDVQPTVDPWEIAGKLRSGTRFHTSQQISERVSHEGHEVQQGILKTAAPSEQVDTHAPRKHPLSTSSVGQRQGQATEEQSVIEPLTALEAQIHWRIDAAMSHLEVALLGELRQILQEELRPMVTQVITQAVLEATKMAAVTARENREQVEQMTSLPAETRRL